MAVSSRFAISIADVHRLAALVHARRASARSCACSTFSTVSTPKITGTPVSSDARGEARGGLARDVVEMRRVAADHAAQRDHRIVAPTGRQLARGQRQLEGAGHAQDHQLIRAATAA
jgi:hypothetical protein